MMGADEMTDIYFFENGVAQNNYELYNTNIGYRTFPRISASLTDRDDRRTAKS
jgi:hypothetical protein